MALMYAYLDPSQDPNDPNLAHRQDFEPTFEEEFPDLRNNICDLPTEATQKKKKPAVIKTTGGIPKHKNKLLQRSTLTTNTKTLKCMSSFVKTKMEKNGHRLIKIKVYDLNESPELSNSENDGAIVSAQYVVVEPFDDIMDQTECLVSKISKKLCTNGN